VRQSNFDATELDMIMGINVNDQVPLVGSPFSPGSSSNVWQSTPVSLTVSTNVGHWDYHFTDSDGLSYLDTASLTLTGYSDDLVDNEVKDVNLVLPPNYQGDVSISYSFQDTVVDVDGSGVVQSVGSRSDSFGPIAFNVGPTDDGSYMATIQNMKAVGGVAPAPDVPAQVNPTGVRAGIDWTTLTRIGRDNNVQSTDPGTGKTYTETGWIWQVKTVKGSVVTLFEADPKNMQPAATQAIPSYQDPTYNCHGFTFAATNVVCKDGVTRSFQIVQTVDVNTILADAYTKISELQAWNIVSATPRTQDLFFVWFNGNNQPVHSAVNSAGPPPQQYWRTHFYGYLTGLGDKTVVGSKNGSLLFDPTTTIGALNQKYPGCTIRIYILQQP
jgi:hypothetical protein